MKSIRLALIVLFFCSASTFARQVFRGENIWKLQKQVTEASCDATITQNDIPVTISRPGHYCLAESVSFEGDAVITITATDNVVLDLNGHEVRNTVDALNELISFGFVDCINTLTAQGLTIGEALGQCSTELFCDESGILVSTSTHVVIKNGFVNGGLSNICIQESNDVLLSELMLDASIIFQGVVGTTLFNSVYAADAESIVIDKCQCKGAIRLSSFISSAVGLETVLPVTKCLMRDCVVNSNIFFGVASQDCCLLNCKVFGEINNNGTDNAFLSCLVNIPEGGQFRMKEFSTRSVVRNCTVISTELGIEVDDDASKVIIRDCNIHSELIGIDIRGNECQVIDNAITGTGAEEGISVRSGADRCQVVNNVISEYLTGISISASSDETQVLSNKVVGTSAGTGITNSGTGSRIFNNIVNNFTTNYFGVDAATIELVPTTSTGYWANVSV